MNRRGFLKNLGLASVGLTIAGNLVLPAFSAPINNKKIILIDNMWYDLEEYIKMDTFIKDQEKRFYDWMVTGVYKSPTYSQG